VRDEVLGGLPTVEAARKLIDFEKGAGEEYLTEINVRIASLVEKNQAVKKILESIAEDEKGHAEILQFVTEIC